MTPYESVQQKKEVLLEEYKYLTTEILSNQSSQRKMIGFALTAAAPIITIVTYYNIENLINARLTMVAFLFAIAFVYSTMAIIYLGLLRGTLRISEYLNKVLIPDINRLIGTKGELFKWELYLSKEVKGKLWEFIGFCFHTGGELISLMAPSIFSFVLLGIFCFKWYYYKHWLFDVLLAIILVQYVLIVYYSVRTVCQSIALKKVKFTSAKQSEPDV